MLNILYFASLREQLSCNQEQVNYIPGETVRQLAVRLAAQHAGVASDLCAATTRCAVNQRLASEAEQLADGAEVAFFPPVTGG
ncbi:MAG: MoaD/ThiS family protein [Pseudomonadales bacterium]|nr:MoaD/ThiS family protein [Pseudomonadales bacterium]